MRGGSLLFFFFFFFFCSCFIFSLPLRSDRGRFSRLLFFSSLSLLLFVFFGCSDGMEREACVCDHGFERSDLCAEIIINNNNCVLYVSSVVKPYSKWKPKNRKPKKSEVFRALHLVNQGWNCTYSRPSRSFRYRNPVQNRTNARLGRRRPSGVCCSG